MQEIKALLITLILLALGLTAIALYDKLDLYLEKIDNAIATSQKLYGDKQCQTGETKSRNELEN